MKEKEVIYKWLNHEPLNEKELEAFNNLDASDSYVKLSEMAKNFKAPEYSFEKNWNNMSSELKTRTSKTTSRSIKSIVLKIAAVLVLGFGLFFAFFMNDKPTVATGTSEITSFELPDQSRVRLNARSSVKYDEENWSNKRKISLEGEAFFGVQTGNRFDVETPIATVSVLGTQFNVKQRDAYLEVTCYEGMVSVLHNEETYYLRPADVIEIRNNKVSKTIAKSMEPNWFTGRSLFVKEPYSKVLEEFEWQYGVKFSSKNIDTSKLFTGNFVHSDIKNALKSILIPMRLKYEIKNNKIRLYSE